jgi:hypothetical protein
MDDWQEYVLWCPRAHSESIRPFQVRCQPDPVGHGRSSATVTVCTVCTGLAYASVKTDAPRLTLKHPMGVCDCRGDGSFGILSYGSCGYTNSDASIPFANDAVAASADANPDYPGSCGRCYEVRCKPGLVVGGCRTRVIAGLQNVSGSWESYRRQQGSQAALTHIHRVSSACCSLHDVGSPPLHRRVLAVSADRVCGC